MSRSFMSETEKLKELEKEYKKILQKKESEEKNQLLAKKSAIFR